MGKSGKRRVAKSSRPTQRLLLDKELVEGVRGPSACTIRLAQPSDREAVRRIISLTGVETEDEVLECVASENPSQLLRKGMQGDRNEAFRLAAALLSRDGGLYEVAIGLTTVLVAQDRGGQVVGALVMHPALNVLRQFLTAGLPLPEAVVFAMTVGKLRGLAVSEPVRQQGIGSALLSFGKRAYFQAGYYVIFGQLVTGRGLEDYYRGRGFEVLGKSEPLSLDVILGKPAAVGPESPNEWLFVKWR